MPDVLLFEPCDFADYPVGGQTSFCRQMMSAFGNRLALVGVSTDGTPIGRWITKRFNGSEHQFFAFGPRTTSVARPLIPARITAFLNIVRHKRAIMSLGIRNAFTQSPETLMAIHGWAWESICYMIPGDANPLKMARYRWARPFTGLYDVKLFSSLKDADVILACADRSGIESFLRRSRGLLGSEQILPFPTRVDTSVFKPQPTMKIRAQLGFKGSGPLLVACGRINTVKGWDLVFWAFRNFLRRHAGAHLVFVGDGEDRTVLEKTISGQNMEDSVRIVGFQTQSKVVEYLNAADVVVVGSHKEGWSVAMLEALACGRPVVSTDVSGARDMIEEGRNGFIVSSRDPEEFAAAVEKALVLETPNPVSLSVAEKYSLANLREDLCRLWEPLR